MYFILILTPNGLWHRVLSCFPCTFDQPSFDQAINLDSSLLRITIYLGIDLKFREVKKDNLQAHLDEQSQTRDSMLMSIFSRIRVSPLHLLSNTTCEELHCALCQRPRLHPLIFYTMPQLGNYHVHCITTKTMTKN